MQIKELKIQNYRCLNTLLRFSPAYNAISGKNNSGKTSVIRVIRNLFKGSAGRYDIEEEGISYKDDFPFWKRAIGNEDPISIEFKLLLNMELDPGLYRFVQKFYEKPLIRKDIILTIKMNYFSEKVKNEIKVLVGKDEISNYNANEILQKVQSSSFIIFHSSTDPVPRFFLRQRFSAFTTEFSLSEKDEIKKLNKNIKSKLGKVAKRHKEDISNILGRLEEKYAVGITTPEFDIDYLPFDISLSDKNVDVSLDEWGSGTRNRTLILLSLLKAKRIAETRDDPSKITPIVVVEEPESFLHPSAQAEFGRILQNLASEFNIQVLVTTHSIYMLCQKEPTSNILLERKTLYRKKYEAEVVKIKHENWMEPFAVNLGISNREFEPWRDILSNKGEIILLVEGDTDKEYFRLLQDNKHGINKLRLLQNSYILL